MEENWCVAEEKAAEEEEANLPVTYIRLGLNETATILITKAKNEIEAFPPYCRGYSLSTFVVKA